MSGRPSGFTLVELLVVIAIIGILIALLLPAVQFARESARAAHCWNNMRQIGIALHTYHDACRVLPPGWSGESPEEPPGWGWASTILPQLEQSPIDAKIHRHLAIADSLNAEARVQTIPVFLCPSDGREEVFVIFGGLEEDEDHEDEGHGDSIEEGTPLFEIAKSNYPAVFGTREIEEFPADGDGTFFFRSRVTLAEITDGLSNTLFIGERHSRRGGTTWTGVVPEANEAMARIVGSTDHTPNHPDHHFDDFTSHHPKGVHFLLGDASVRRLNDVIDLAVYQALATRQGHEVAPAP
jgi:prepilin-type N-terminal cleavage/methylation domain-containing protein